MRRNTGHSDTPIRVRVGTVVGVGVSGTTGRGVEVGGTLATLAHAATIIVSSAADTLSRKFVMEYPDL